jgi:hypothetical protein
MPTVTARKLTRVMARRCILSMTYEVASCNYEVGNSEKKWRSVGEGLWGLHDARHTAQVFVARQQEALTPRHAMIIAPKHDAKWL